VWLLSLSSTASCDGATESSALCQCEYDVGGQ
jgi:hypothetical protein